MNPTLGRSPIRLLALVAASIFAVETLIMVALHQFAPLDPWLENLLDALLLVVLLYPMLQAFMLRPMQRQVLELEAAASALRQEQARTEALVVERTAELRDANQALAAAVGGLEKRNRDITLLAEMVDLFQACRTQEEAFAVIARSAAALLGGQPGTLYVFRASRNVVEPACSWSGLEGALPFAPEECWALRRGRPHLVEEPSAPTACLHVASPRPPAWLCVPMMAQGEALGVLLLESRPDAGSAAPLTERTGLATAFAEHVALALANLRLREALRSQAIRDPLTGLFNRRYLEETLERERHRAERRGNPLGVVMIDVDHFKRFNDTWGHDAGDVVLRELGALLRGRLRVEDVACRYGGEEFAVVLPDAGRDAARSRAEGLREAAKALAVRHGGRPLGPVTISLGVAAYPDDGESPEALLQAADMALYRAKEAGRDRVVVAEGSAARG